MISSETGKEVIKKELALIPKLPGVYRMLNDKDLRSIVNYATIVKLINKLIKKKHYNFLETLAEAVFNELFKDKRLGNIMLKIEKMEILKECSSVGIQITKKRSHDKF